MALEALTECDVGLCENLSWDEVERSWPEDFARFQADPWSHGYPGGESLADVYARVAPALEALMQRHEGETVLVVTHHVVLRVYLAALLGLPPEHSRQVSLANASFSVVVRHHDQTRVALLNDVRHL